MTQDHEKIDELHDRRVITTQSASERQKFCRVYPEQPSPTHCLSWRWDGYKLEVWQEPRPIEEVMLDSRHFQDLGVAHLRWLAERHQLDPKVICSRGQVTGDRDVLIKALQGKFPLPKGAMLRENPKSETRNPNEVTVPIEIREMSEAGLETRSVENGIRVNRAWRKLPRREREKVLALKLAQKASECSQPTNTPTA